MISNGTGDTIGNKTLKSLVAATYLRNNSSSKLSETKLKVEEKKGMNFDDILSIYKKETLDLIANGEKEKIKKIREIDPVYVESKKRYDDFITYLEDNDVYDAIELELDCCISEETLDKICSTEHEATELRNILNDILGKVKAMLRACNTYEQGIEILKAYDILKPNLTLNILDSDELFGC